MINIKETKKEFLTLLKKENLKKITDLGCGKGFMLNFFQEPNLIRIGIDLKKECENENFKFILGDIKKVPFESDNSLIISSLVLHFFEEKDAENVIKKMKDSTHFLGYNLLVCLSNQDILSKNNPKKFYPSLTKLKELYKEWSLIKELEGFSETENHDNLGEHNHHILFLLFKKDQIK